MAILTITSNNDNLSFIIQKNPETGLFLKTVKQGMMFGYFPKENNITNVRKYVVYFKDASDKITYKVHPDEQFEYLNSSKYNDARFINDAIQECLHSAREWKGESGSYDVPCNYSIHVNLVNTEFKTIDIFRRYFPNVEIRSEEVSKNNYQLTFINDKPTTLQYMLRVINLFSIFAQLNSPTYSYLTEDLVKKYVRICNEIDAPYFIRYLIKIRMCRSVKSFETMKTELETTSRYPISMQFGDTHLSRIAYIRTLLDTNHSIVDIGTGIDYRYMKIFAPILKDKNLMYYAIEIDPDARERIKAAVRNRELDDCVELFESLEDFIKYHDEYLTKEKLNVICTEVLEHNKFPIAQSIVKKVLKTIQPAMFVITVPNKEFNQFYEMDKEFRHDDHEWEADIQNILDLLPNGLDFRRVKIEGVGDSVNHINVSYGLVIHDQQISDHGIKC